MAIETSDIDYRPSRVLVEHEGEWYPGTRHFATSAPDGTLMHLVTWQLLEGEMRLDRFPCSRLAYLD